MAVERRNSVMLRRILTWFFQQRRAEPAGAEAAFVPIRDKHGNLSGIIDKLTADYLQSSAPDPTQQTLNEILASVTRVRVLEGGVMNGKALGTRVLLDCTDIPSLNSLRSCLTIVEDPKTFGHCMCVGNPTLECFADQHLVATIGLHHGRSIRWDAWKHDALLQDGKALLNWLADRNISDPLAEHQADERMNEEFQQAARYWQEAMPRCLRQYWTQMQGFKVDLVPLRQALEKEYPDQTARALALFSWFGAGQGPWSGFPMYESVPEQLLLESPTEIAISALSNRALTTQQLEGAARFFAGWEFRKHPQSELDNVPAELKKQLLEHTLTSPDQDKVQRAKKAFA